MDKTDKKYHPYKVSPGAQLYVADIEEENKELKEDIRKIKLIMAYPDRDIMDAHYEYSFYDEELTKINWINGKQARK